MKKEMKISTLLRATSLGTILAVLLCIICGNAIFQRVDELVNISNARAESQIYATSMKQASDYLTNQIRYYSVTGKKEYYDNYYNEVNNLKTREKAIENLVRIGILDSEKKLIDQSLEYSNTLIPIEEEAMAKVEAKKTQEAISLVYGETYQDYKDKIDNNVQSFIDQLETRMSASVDREISRLMFVLGVSGAMLAVIFFICVCDYFAYRRRIITPTLLVEKNLGEIAGGRLEHEVPLEETTSEIGNMVGSLKRMRKMFSEVIQDISDTLGKMAAGDMTQEITREYIGDFQRIKTSINHISSSLNATLVSIDNTSEQVASGADLVSQSSEELSKGASEQSYAMDQLSQTMKKISDKASAIAQSAFTANNQAHLVGEKIQQCNGKMEDMTEAMEKINVSSSRIQSIIKTIDDIAFQTNILALNAAVEAARAGQAGKGFAVVADEVRNLASKSAEAVKNTAALIEESVHAVGEGSSIASETAEYLSAVVQDVEQVEQTVQEITTASSEQSASVQAMNEGMAQISSVVQANSATAQQSAAASEALSDQAQTLKRLTNQFLLRKAQERFPAPAPALASESSWNAVQEEDAFSKY